MDVTRTPLPGWTPLRPGRQLLPALTAGGGGAVASGVAQPRESSAVAVPATLDGEADGPDVVLASGVRIRRLRIGAFRVPDARVWEAIRAVQLLPVQDQVALARTGIAVELLPLRNLEQVAGTIDPVIGATTIDGPLGKGVPTRLRIAADSAALNRRASVTEAVQHEIGHVLAVMTRQDRSEATAIAYAKQY